MIYTHRFYAKISDIEMDSTVSLKFYEKNGFGDYIKDKIPSIYGDVGDKLSNLVVT